MDAQTQMLDSRFAIYVRSSPKTQAQSIDVDGQVAAARACGEMLGLRLNFQCIFVDIGSTIAKQRPGLEAMLRIAQAKVPPFGAIVVDDHDRLYRDQVALTHCIQQLEKRGISVVSVKGSAVELAGGKNEIG